MGSLGIISALKSRQELEESIVYGAENRTLDSDYFLNWNLIDKEDSNNGQIHMFCLLLTWSYEGNCCSQVWEKEQILPFPAIR